MGRGPAGAAALLLLCLACGRQPRPEAITIGLGSVPLSLDPHLTNESASYTVNENIYDALVKTDADLRVGPSLARSWSNPDDVTWTFELKQGVRFHNGRPFTAADVVFSLGRARNDPSSDWKGALVAVQKVDALSSHTVAVTTARPFPTLLKSLVGISIVPAGSGASLLLESRPVGTGPYRFVSRDDRGGTIRLRRWNGYHGAPPPLREVRFRALPEERERVRALLDGSIDLIADVGTDSAERLAASPRVRVLRVPGLRELFLAFDVRRERTPYVSAGATRSATVACASPSSGPSTHDGSRGRSCGALGRRRPSSPRPASSASTRATSDRDTTSPRRGG